MRLACTYVLSTKCESEVVIRNSCSLLARSGHTKEFAILVNQIFPTLTGGLITAIIPVYVGKRFTNSSDFKE